MSANDSDALDPLVEACNHCGARIDVSSAMPIQDVVCHVCGGTNRVRTRLQNYLIESVLGSGGMGFVYKAFDLNLERHVALKVIRQELGADPELLKKFEEEAQLTAIVNNPNVVRVFSFGSDHGLLFIAMELVGKGNLNELLELQGKIAEVQALEIGIQIATGLQSAYDSGLLHRDVKPGNILFMDAHSAKIVDFGLAQFMEREAVGTDEIWGTSYYIPPERLNRLPEDLRSDIYALGATLFHAIAGRPPYEAETASLVALKHITSKVPSLQSFAPDVSSSTAFVINRMLQRDPNDRYQTYDELIEHLKFAYDKLLESPATVPGSQEHVVLEDSQSQNATFWITVATFVIMFLIGSGVLIYSGNFFQKEDPSSPAAIERKYQKGRELILKGDYPGAKKALGEVCSAPKLHEPQGSWSYLHLGLAAMLEGKADESNRTFQKLYQQGMYSTAKPDSVLANFFVETGRIIAQKKPASRGTIKFYNPNNCEAMALFVFGVYDRQLQRVDDEKAFLEAFVKSDPKPPFAWISDYKPIARTLLAEIDSKAKR